MPIPCKYVFPQGKKTMQCSKLAFHRTLKKKKITAHLMNSCYTGEQGIVEPSYSCPGLPFYPDDLFHLVLPYFPQNHYIFSIMMSMLRKCWCHQEWRWHSCKSFLTTHYHNPVHEYSGRFCIFQPVTICNKTERSLSDCSKPECAVSLSVRPALQVPWCSLESGLAFSHP